MRGLSLALALALVPVLVLVLAPVLLGRSLDESVLVEEGDDALPLRACVERLHGSCWERSLSPSTLY